MANALESIMGQPRPKRRLISSRRTVHAPMRNPRARYATASPAAATTISSAAAAANAGSGAFVRMKYILSRFERTSPALFAYTGYLSRSSA